MNFIFKVIILFFVIITSNAQSNEKIILPFIKNLNIEGVDTIAVFETLYSGSDMRTDSCKYKGFYKRYEIIWLKNGNTYIKPFSSCAEYKTVKDNSMGLFEFYKNNRSIIKKDNDGLLHFQKMNHQFFYNVKFYFNKDFVNLTFTDGDFNQENDFVSTNKSLDLMILYFKTLHSNKFALIKYLNLKSKRKKS